MEQNELLRQSLDKSNKRLMRKVNQLNDAQKELKKRKEELTETRRRLVETADRLAVSEASLKMMKKATDMTVLMMKDHLFSWLSPQNQFRVNRMLRFYNKEQQVTMMNGLLNYLIFGNRPKLKREVERWHFKIICDFIDQDMITLPAHSLMVKLFKKYGLLEQLNSYQQAAAVEEDFRPHGEEW